jgi:hypothetical protein
VRFARSQGSRRIPGPSASSLRVWP